MHKQLTYRGRRLSLRISIRVCLLTFILMSARQVGAAPAFAPFLAVDIDGYNAGGGQTLGVTEPGFASWEMVEGLFLPPSIDWGSSGAAGLTQLYPTSQGNITANVRGVAPNSFLGARNRGDNSDGQGGMTQDFVFAQRNVDGFGQHFIRISLSGLAPGQVYEVTAYARDHFNGGTDSFQAWTDRNALGGLDGPGAWMDANVGANAVYQPAIDGVNNPLPTLGRTAVSGPSSLDPYAFGTTFLTIADGSGVVTFYGWADPNTYSGVQGSSLLNGFQVAVAPEPSTMALFGVGLMFLAGRRRHAIAPAHRAGRVHADLVISRR